MDQDKYQLPEGLLLLAVAILALVVVATLVRAYLTGRGRRDTGMLDRVVLGGLAALGVVVLVSVLWVLVEEPEALFTPVAIIGMTLVFFAVGIVAAFGVSVVAGLIGRAIRR